MSGQDGKPFDIPKRLVWQAWKRVAENGGAAGVDGVTIEDFKADLGNNLYKIWNRMSSGTYFPPPVRAVEIPKASGGTRLLGVPTVGDRVAQTVAAMALEPRAESIFHDDSYGYRRERGALDAVGTCRERCWQRSWVIDLDIRKFLNPWSHCSFAHCGGQNSPSWTAGGSIRRPFLRPVRTWTARSRPSLTRCMMVCRETP
jgi:RNA-directed DNA polymerase